MREGKLSLKPADTVAIGPKTTPAPPPPAHPDPIPPKVLASGDLALVEETLRAVRYPAGKKGFRRDFNQLTSLLDHPSQHVWITFEDGCLWWCTVRNEVKFDTDEARRDRGHFWLSCERGWSNSPLVGRELSIVSLPGTITRTKGFRDTVCKPVGWKEVLRVIRGDVDMDAITAQHARDAYVAAILKLVHKLHDKDFEALVDLVLSRNGWARLERVGGTSEGTDLEAENAAINEIAFVQVKCSAGQADFDSSFDKFKSRPRFKRMIFAVHSPVVSIRVPDDPRIQLWTGEKIADLVVKHGLGDWVASRVQWKQ